MRGFQYEMTQRPFGIGCQPKGHISVTNSSRAQTGYHSIVEYEFPLTPEQVSSYELTPLVVDMYEVEDNLKYQGVEVFCTYDDAFRFAQKRGGETGCRQFIYKVSRQMIGLSIPPNELPER